MARLWLGRFKDDASKMGDMRRLLYQERGGPAMFGMPDEKAIDQVVELLARGRLHIHAIPIETRGTSQASSTDNPPAPFPLSGRQPRAAVTSSAAPFSPPTFSSDMDPSIQAATLVAAAASGKPFCPE